MATGRNVMGSMLKLRQGWVRVWMRLVCGALGAGVFFAGARLEAVERKLDVLMPSAVGAAEDVPITIRASTDAGRGEQVGFLQVEASTDGGRTWAAVCYLSNVGASVAQSVHVKAGPAGSSLRLRARAAFRDGLAGDVDWRGAAIRWHESWNDWQEPPARYAEVAVQAR